ncbi:MAG TPA: urate oxidase [Actinopolymorphaceae bacterium]|jgi:urate oxidase|nr:urate oxidase [Actinopolymorphaceae bacterium]
MGVEIEGTRYGKAETRLVRITRDTARHEIIDLNVSITLTGDLADSHLTGDNAKVLPTDSQKNTVYAFARDGIGQVEEFGLRLARHFVDSQPAIHTACVRLEEYVWTRVGDHSFSRSAGGETRTAEARYDGATATVSAGLSDLLLLNSTGSEFSGFVVDDYTTLPPTDDRILATAVAATWAYRSTVVDYDKAYAAARSALVEAFADTYSLSLQQTLHAMGTRVLDKVPDATEVSLSLPNKHHFLVDLTPFGRDNPGEVFYAADRPYGLIEGTVRRT